MLFYAVDRVIVEKTRREYLVEYATAKKLPDRFVLLSKQRLKRLKTIKKKNSNTAT